ncbi:hypothetical protein SKAU_G00383030 [Synaphobranchus kaupii]|uniref:C-type lectin domain-containing protein n=1 Tax=Synaphobranchus kaupii TaxID=118154 RepID=A0A9Q1EE29_SYNKA|nr:hypothetical protein SKAU_G00383030 [Synaphobranchus kaupii]
MVFAKSVLLCATILSGIALVSHGASVGSYLDYCPSGWSEHYGRCFMFVKEKRSWADSELISEASLPQMNCQKLGGNLASVHTEDDYSFLKDLVKKLDATAPSFWIGMSDCQKEGTWMWSDGTRVDFTLWNPGEPNNVGEEDCVQGNWPNSNGWNDLSCGRDLGSVCVLRYFYG